MTGPSSVFRYLALLAILIIIVPDGITSFGIPSRSGRTMSMRRMAISSSSILSRTFLSSLSSSSSSLMAKKEERKSMGMEDAFHQLDELKSLDEDESAFPDRKKKQDEAFAKAMKALDLKDIAKEEAAPIEMEVELYKGLASEMETMTETDIIAGIKTDLGGTPSSFPMFDPSTRDTEKFMEEALEQALEEAEKKAQMEINKDSLLDNKEIMKEIEKIFDKANTDLLAGIEEMRMEQMELAKETAARNAKQSQDRMDVEQERLAAAEANMRKLLEKVNQETKNVEMAIEDLRQAQVDIQGGVDDKLTSLKSGGIIKQATLVGTLLFSVRSLAEGVVYLGGDATHLMPAVVQGVIAVVCLIAFLFL